MLVEALAHIWIQGWLKNGRVGLRVLRSGFRVSYLVGALVCSVCCPKDLVKAELVRLGFGLCVSSLCAQIAGGRGWTWRTRSVFGSH